MHRRCRARIERSESKKWRGSVRRILSAAIYNLSCFTHGCSTGWVSGVLGSEALTGGAWLAALPCLVALPAAPFFAVLADTKGRKTGAFCICCIFIISWSLAAWCGAKGVWAARIAAGAGGAGALSLAPLYCAEIAPRTRGLAAMPALACSCGILFAYGAGGILSPHALSLAMAVPPAVLMVSLLWLPETPSYCISKGKMQDAAKIMCWFDGSDFRQDLTEDIEQQEVMIRTSECFGHRRDGLYRHDSDTFTPTLKRCSGLESNSDRRVEEPACQALFRHRRTRRALFSCFILLCVSAGSGVGAVSSFAAGVLRQSAHAADVTPLNVTAYNFTVYNGTVPRSLFETSEAASMLCGTAMVLGAAMAIFAVDKLGRKVLLIWSCTGIAFSLALLGIYCDPRLRQLSWSFKNQIWTSRFKLQSAQSTLSTDNRDNMTTEDLNLNNSIKDIFDKINTQFWYRTAIEQNFNNNSIDTDVIWTSTRPAEVNEKLTTWPPVILLSIVLFMYNIGLGSVPYVLISELFSINVRSLASSFIISWMWLSNFLLLRYYGSIAMSLGLHSTYYICASITFLGSWYTYLFIPETKGISQEQIDEILEGPVLVFRKRKKRRGN